MTTSEETPKVVIPANAKKPSDHKKSAALAKAEAQSTNIVIEYNGITYVLEREVIDDVELLELIGDMTSNPILLPKVVRSILGLDQWAKFKDSNRNDAGRVPSERMRELFELLDAAAGKSSASPAS